jgi:hypothetical protein
MGRIRAAMEVGMTKEEMDIISRFVDHLGNSNEVALTWAGWKELAGALIRMGLDQRPQDAEAKGQAPVRRKDDKA